MNIEALIANEFSRNIGLLSEQEQEQLLLARVAVVGAGGVGGLHILTLARLGVGKFNIADPDTFEAANVSRQFGASNSTYGRNKAEVLAEMVQDINPGEDSSGLANLTVMDNLLYFRADDGAHGAELWRSDGTATNTVMVADIFPGENGSDPNSSAPENLIVVNGTLFFLAYDGPHGVELWAIHSVTRIFLPVISR